MDEKLTRFLNKINFPDIGLFKSSKIIKVSINKLNSSWSVFIENDKTINVEDAMNLINISKKGIDNVSTINIYFKNNNITNEDIISYFKYFLTELIKVSPALSSIINNKITVDNNVISSVVIFSIVIVFVGIILMLRLIIGP